MYIFYPFKRWNQSKSHLIYGLCVCFVNIFIFIFMNNVYFIYTFCKLFIIFFENIIVFFEIIDCTDKLPGNQYKRDVSGIEVRLICM
jgi:hypothetical protein